MAASLKDPGSIPGGGPKRFHDSFNFVFYIVVVSCPTRWSLYWYLGFCDDHLSTQITERQGQQCIDLSLYVYNWSCWQRSEKSVVIRCALCNWNLKVSTGLCHIHVWKFSHSVLSQRQTLVFQSPYHAFSWPTAWDHLFVSPLYLTWFSGFSRGDHKQQFTGKHSDVTIQGPLLNFYVILVDRKKYPNRVPRNKFFLTGMCPFVRELWVPFCCSSVIFRI